MEKTMMVIKIECGYYTEGTREISFQSNDFVLQSKPTILKQDSAFRALLELDVIPEYEDQEAIDDYYDACSSMTVSDFIELVGTRLGECHIKIKD
jgi:hypothetical protein